MSAANGRLLLAGIVLRCCSLVSAFKCYDGSGSELPDTAVNDDYCDCVDGSDESSTSACAGQGDTLFYCENAGSTAQWIYASRVRDGICDCCDGSDEMGAKVLVTCPNHCTEQGLLQKAEREERSRVLYAGLAMQDEVRRKARAERKIWREELKRLQAALPGLEEEVTRLEALAAQNAPPNASLTDEEDDDGMNRPQRASQIEEEDDDGMNRPKTTTREAPAVQFRIAVTKQTGRKLGIDLSVSDPVSLGIKGVNDGLFMDWNNVHPMNQVKQGQRIVEVNSISGSSKDMLDALKQVDVLDILVQEAEEAEAEEAAPSIEAAKGKPEAEEAAASTEAEAAKPQVSEYTKWMEGAEEATESVDSAKIDPVNEFSASIPKKNGKLSLAVKFERRNALITDVPSDGAVDDWNKQANQEHKISKGDCIVTANGVDIHIEKEFRDNIGTDPVVLLIKRNCEATLTTTTTEGADTSEDAEVKKGTAIMEANKLRTSVLQKSLDLLDHSRLSYASLIDTTLEKKVDEHTYKLSFFDKAQQGSTSLGTWSSWTGAHRGSFTGGSKCWQGPSRQMDVTFVCGTEAAILEVSEPSRCVYAAVIAHSGACDAESLDGLVNPPPRGPRDEL